MANVNNLLLLPFLQGLSNEELLQIAGRVRFHFQSRSEREIIARQDSPCKGLIYVTSGEIAQIRRGDGGDYTLTEWFSAPYLVQPEALYGFRTRYSHTFIAASDVRLLEISKEDVRDTLIHYDAFRIGLLNYLSYAVQRTTSSLWRIAKSDIPSRFAHFLLQRSTRPAGRKQLNIRRSELAECLNTTKRQLVPVLTELEEKGLIETTRGKIEIPAFEKLLAYISQN